MLSSGGKAERTSENSCISCCFVCIKWLRHGGFGSQWRVGSCSFQCSRHPRKDDVQVCPTQPSHQPASFTTSRTLQHSSICLQLSRDVIPSSGVSDCPQPTDLGWRAVLSLRCHRDLALKAASQPRRDDSSTHCSRLSCKKSSCLPWQGCGWAL